MKGRGIIVRVVTISSSLLLAAGCISHQAGLFKGPSSDKTGSKATEADFTPFSTTKRSMDRLNLDSGEDAGSSQIYFGGTKHPLRSSSFNFSESP